MNEELQRELAEQAALADAGEAAGVFLHELGNVLNNILLQARLMQQDAPPELQPRLADTCKNISQTAQHMKYLAQFRQARRIRPYAVDLNETLRGAAAALDLAADLPPILSTLADLKRLLDLLLRNAATGDQKPNLTTGSEGDQVNLRVRCAGIQVSDDDMPSLFEPFKRIGSVPNGLELAICRELVRRARGQMAAERDEQGRLCYLISWPRQNG